MDLSGLNLYLGTPDGGWEDIGVLSSDNFLFESVDDDRILDEPYVVAPEPFTTSFTVTLTGANRKMLWRYFGVDWKRKGLYTRSQRRRRKKLKMYRTAERGWMWYAYGDVEDNEISKYKPYTELVGFNESE